jgi:hypothetical protein
MKIIMKPGIEGIDPSQELEYFGKLDDLTFFVVIRPKEDWNYSDFKLKIGKQDDLKEIKVNNVERYRDGGTTVMHTAVGRFYFPCHMAILNNKDLKPMLDEKEIVVFEKK